MPHVNELKAATHGSSILCPCQGLNESELLQSGASVGYVWDDLGLPHKLTVKVSGKPLHKLSTRKYACTK